MALVHLIERQINMDELTNDFEKTLNFDDNSVCSSTLITGEKNHDQVEYCNDYQNEFIFESDRENDENRGEGSDSEESEVDDSQVKLFIDNFVDFDYNSSHSSCLKIVATQQYRPKLAEQGYFFTIDKMDTNVIYWKCERTGSKKVSKCPGRAQSNGFVKPILETIEHNHEPDPIREEVLVVIARILKRSYLTNENPRTIIKECLENLSSEAAAIMPRMNSLTQKIRRILRKKIVYGKNPESVNEIDLKAELKITLRKEAFLWDDSGADDHKRILVFATERNIAILNEVKIWFIDGTFDSCPLIFKQIFTVQAFKNGSRSVREKVRFAPASWNVHDRVLKDMPRTNNNIESWHKNFETDAKKHPTINGLVNQFQKEQSLTDMLIDQLNSGDVYVRRNKVISRDEKIKFLCKNYKLNDLANFLNGLMANI
ncbi:unnamed protein product [Brachionus calyciflorus]|uniref:FLYWCH-type domain-containing protein n=1 Tax=Brachionus calyciflorus TaxID=104777 RepID=A0A814BJH4_9BILA|nr:unnamed protein product [Brachionus calyciflorus]